MAGSTEYRVTDLICPPGRLESGSIAQKKTDQVGHMLTRGSKPFLAFLRTMTRLETTCCSFTGPALSAFSFLSSTETQFFPLHERLLHGWEHDGIRLFSKCIREARTFSGKT